MAVNAFTSNQGTQTAILTDNTGGTAGTVIPVMKVSMDGQGTYTDANLFQGTLLKLNTVGTLPNIPGGTIGSVTGIGSVSGLSNLPGGSIAITAGTIASVGTIGTIGLGSVVVNTLPNIPGGTIGSVIGVGSVSGLSNLPQGSINVTAGTMGGKAASGAAISGNPIPIGGTDSGGTVYTFLTDTKGQQYLGGGTVGTVLGVTVVTTVTNLSNGTIQSSGTTSGVGTVSNIGSLGVLNAGTLTTIPNIPGGTIGSVIGIGSISGLSNLPQGSIQVTAGTFRQDGRPTQNILTYGTQIAGTAAIAATIIGSTSVGAGTFLWLQDISITNNNANVLCVLGFGTAQQGTNVLLRHTLGTSGAVGIEKSLAKPANAGMTNQDLVFSLGAAGTVDVTLSYFISA